jgi:hypothetical protein
MRVFTNLREGRLGRCYRRFALVPFSFYFEKAVPAGLLVAILPGDDGAARVPLVARHE